MARIVEDHRTAAERLLKEADRRPTHEERIEALAAAQVHAVLALTDGERRPPSADLLSIDEVSEMTRIPVNTLRYYRSVGADAPASIKVGRRVRYPEDGVRRWLAERGDRDSRS